MAAVSDLGDELAPVYLWINPKFEDAGVVSDIEALPLVRAATEVHAHNAPFEQAICSGTGMLPEITLDKWRCTQAMARIAALPESLEKCGAALNILNQKDKLGKDLIKFFSIPQEDGTFNEPRDHRIKWAQFCEYCRQDVRAEREIHHYLKARFSLVGTNLDTFQFTLRLNDTGVPVNVPALQNAQRIITEVETEAGAEFLQLTKLNITQRAKILALLQAGGLVIADMQSDTLQTALAHPAVAPSIRRVLELYCQLSYAATKKITAMLNWVCPDDRLHGVFKFYGAGTGRWTAGGPQVQNAKKPSQEMRPRGVRRRVCVQSMASPSRYSPPAFDSSSNHLGTSCWMGTTTPSRHASPAGYPVKPWPWTNTVVAWTATRPWRRRSTQSQYLKSPRTSAR